MTLLRFDESQLVTQLRRLRPQLRAVFAAICAQRLLPAYVSLDREQAPGNPTELAKILEQLWCDLEGHATSVAQVQDGIDRATGAIPFDDDPGWTPAHAYTENAATALTYALRSRQNESAQEAAWAARHGV